MKVLVLLLLSCWKILVSASAEPQTLIVRTVEGENVILPCKAPNTNLNISAVSWTRLDLGKDQHVLLYRNKKIVSDSQHPSYKNRVNLNEELKDGDVSLNLNNVTFNDRGTFECFVVHKETGSRMKRSLNTKSRLISLSVDPPGELQEKTSGGGRVVPTVAALISVVVGIFLL